VSLLSLSLLGPAMAGSVSAFGCGFCQAAVVQVEQLARGNYSMDNMEALFRQSCTVLKIDSWCPQSLVPKIKTMIPGIQQRLPPPLICQQAALCGFNANQPRPTGRGPSRTPTGRGPPRPQVRCSLCKRIISSVEFQLKKNVSVPDLRGIVNTTCAKASAIQWCTQQLLPKLSTLAPQINKKVSSSKVCQSLGVCNNSKSANLETIEAEEEEETPMRSASARHCNYCRSVVKNVKVTGALLGDDSAAVSLDSLCARLSEGDSNLARLCIAIGATLNSRPAKHMKMALCSEFRLC